MDAPETPVRAHRAPMPRLAWCVIALLTTLIALMPLLESVLERGLAEAVTKDMEAHAAEVEPEAEADPEDYYPDASVMENVQARVLLGQLSLLPDTTTVEPLLNSDEPAQRLRGVAMCAVINMDLAKAKLEPMAKAETIEAPLAAIMLRALDGKGTPEDKTVLKDKLGLFGEMAWARGMDADQLKALKASAMSMIGMLVAGLCVVGLAALVGLVLGLVAITRVRAGRLGSALAPAHARHGLYAETFAVWMIVFNVLSILAAIVADALDTSPFIVLVLFFPASLVSLSWPSLRGSSFSQTCADIGLTRGAGLLKEFGAGVVGWMCMLPIQGIGMLLTVAFMALAGVQEGDADAPSHPIVDAFTSAPVIMASLLVAVVMAPLVEEIVFRGLLYRQLRSVGVFGRGLVSVLAPAFITGFVFAAIHPQGWMGIPALMGIAVAVALAREWRGSLIAPMVMHGINNGLALSALLTILYA